MKNYKTILFDCDGVILDANKLKSCAFFDVASNYSIPAAHELVLYNQEYGGVSRHQKFEYFIRNILPKYTNEKPDHSKLVKKFAKFVRQGLLECEVTPHLQNFASRFPKSKFAVVSGGDQSELRNVFSTRNISKYFSGGIWGNPATKYEIIENHFSMLDSNLTLFIGDSELDYKVAQYYGFDFIFVSALSECKDWMKFVEKNSILNFPTLGDILK